MQSRDQQKWSNRFRHSLRFCRLLFDRVTQVMLIGAFIGLLLAILHPLPRTHVPAHSVVSHQAQQASVVIATPPPAHNLAPASSGAIILTSGKQHAVDPPPTSTPQEACLPNEASCATPTPPAPGAPVPTDIPDQSGKVPTPIAPATFPAGPPTPPGPTPTDLICPTPTPTPTISSTPTAGAVPTPSLCNPIIAYPPLIQSICPAAAGVPTPANPNDVEVKGEPAFDASYASYDPASNVTTGAYGRLGEVDLHKNENIDGHALDSINWVISETAFNQGALSPAVTNIILSTFNNCAITVIAHFFSLVADVLTVLAIILLGYYIIFWQFQNNANRGMQTIVIPVIIAILGSILSPWLITQLLDLNSALITHFALAMGVTPAKFFDYVGNIGLIYEQSRTAQNYYTPGNFAGLLTTFGFVEIIVMTFLTELFLIRFLLIDILIVLAPVAVCCYMIPSVRRWTEFWMKTLITTILQQSLIMLVLLVGVMLVDSNFLGIQSNPMAGNFFLSCVYLSGLRIPGLLRNVFGNKETAIESRGFADVQREFTNWYIYNKDPVRKFNEGANYFNIASAAFTAPQALYDAGKFFVDVAKGLKSAAKKEEALSDVSEELGPAPPPLSGTSSGTPPP